MKCRIVLLCPIHNTNQISLEEKSILAAADLLTWLCVILKIARCTVFQTVFDIIKIINNIKIVNNIIKIINKMGPNTDPWSTPLMTMTKMDYIPFTVTNCFRSKGNCFIQENNLPLIPKRLSLWRRISWSTLSNASAKSKQITSCSFPF